MISSLRHPEASEEQGREGRGIEPKSPSALKNRVSEKGLKGEVPSLPKKEKKKKKKRKKGSKTSATPTAVVRSTTVPNPNVWERRPELRLGTPSASVEPREEARSTVVKRGARGRVGRAGDSGSGPPPSGRARSGPGAGASGGEPRGGAPPVARRRPDAPGTRKSLPKITKSAAISILCPEGKYGDTMGRSRQM